MNLKEIKKMPQFITSVDAVFFEASPMPKTRFTFFSLRTDIFMANSSLPANKCAKKVGVVY